MGLPDYPVPSIGELIELNLRLGRLTNPAIRCAGVSLNTAALSPEEALALLDRESEALGTSGRRSDARRPTIQTVDPGVSAMTARSVVTALAAAFIVAGPDTLDATPVAPFQYDIVIRNGRLLDGAGNPWVRADVGIRDGRFAQVGRVTGHGRREIDATGDYVSPGWIDMMDQSGEVLRVNGLAENKLREGVTTAIAGEGGAPVPSAQLAAYFEQLQRQGISLNFGTYYGAAQARVEVMGDVAGEPSAQQMDQMKAHVAEAMRAGALGIATALIYPPDSFQTTNDLIELARVAAQYGGIYASHMRSESADLLKAIGESIEIGAKTGIEVEIFHFKAAYAPGWGKLTPEAGALIDAARSRGVNIAADMYVYTAGGTGLDITVPNWVSRTGCRRVWKS